MELAELKNKSAQTILKLQEAVFGANGSYYPRCLHPAAVAGCGRWGQFYTANNPGQDLTELFEDDAQAPIAPDGSFELDLPQAQEQDQEHASITNFERSNFISIDS